MADAELGGAFGLKLDQMAEIIAKPLHRAAVEAGPESRLAHSLAAALGHALVIIGNARDHVNVRVDVIHVILTIVVWAFPRWHRNRGRKPAGCVRPGRR